MKLKRGLTLALFLMVLLTATFALAQEETETETDKSYSCLEAQLGTNCGDTQNTEQVAFNLIAMAYDSSIKSNCKSALKEKESDNCWGNTGSTPCNIKSTALSTLALNHIEEDVDDSLDWLLGKRKLDTGLIWFLEIDANNVTKCSINGKEVTIQGNKKISGSDPSGLKKAYSNYWFEVTDISKNYTISCDKSFITTLLYKKPGSNIYFIPSKTKSASAYDSVTEKVESYCFSTSSQCDYEGSLWATVALAKLGEDISPYLPYLSAVSDETSNRKYLSSAFLYMLTNADDYYSELVIQQKQDKYWDESGDKLYDSALALLALQDVTSGEVENTKEHLLDIRDSSGCWRSNTAFILYAGWPKIPASGSDIPTSSDCEAFGYYCTASLECADEETLNNFRCFNSLSDVCCETQPDQQTCAEKQGEVCSLDQECIGDEVNSLDETYCCQGTCQSISDENECEELNYVCKDTCSNGEEEKMDYSNACSLGEICCADKPSEKGNWMLIILLIVLIILVILAIIFRNQLKIWLFKVKTKFKVGKGPGSITRPTMPPPGFGGQMMPQMSGFPVQRRAPTRRMPSRRPEKDKDFDETMKKLKDMSK